MKGTLYGQTYKYKFSLFLSLIKIINNLIIISERTLLYGVQYRRTNEHTFEFVHHNLRSSRPKNTNNHVMILRNFIKATRKWQ